METLRKLDGNFSETFWKAVEKVAGKLYRRFTESCREGELRGERGRTCFADGQVSHHMFFPCPVLDGLEASLEREVYTNVSSTMSLLNLLFSHITTAFQML